MQNNINKHLHSKRFEIRVRLKEELMQSLLKHSFQLVIN